ncbi:MAG: hypothetical protein ACSLE3_07410, partial [Microbacteriaceae bacterium]
EKDIANAASLAVGAGPAASVSAPVTQAAVKVNAVAPETPIAPMAPRPGEATAGLIEAGSSSTGATFHTACRSYESAFEAAAVAARNAQGAVSAGITGQTGPKLSAALNKFASWADQMASHSATVAKAAQDHGGRFDRTQQETPRTQQFTDTRQSMTRAQMLMMQTGGLMGSDQFVRYGNHLQQLDTKATTAGVSYHLSELPQAPPPPPPVTDIVNDGASAPNEGSGQPGERKPAGTEDQQGAGAPSELDAASSASGADPLADPMADPAADPLLTGGEGASPMGGDPMQQIMPMAAMIPAALAGALGGAMGAVTSVPQQLMGAAQQVMQGAASSMQEEPDLGLDDPLDDAGLSDFGSGLGSGGGGGGGGGGMEPAGLDTSLPPGAGALGAASAPAGGGGPALPTASGTVGPTSTSAPAGAGMGGMGMMPPMMGGMGGGGAGGDRAKPPPDKTVVIPSIPNGEPVKGEVERRQTVSVDNAAAKASTGDQAAPGRPRRRVTMPPDSEGDAK